MKIIIDRFENDIAVVELENGKFADLPKIFIPENAKEGSVIHIICNDDETEKRRTAMKEKMDSLFH